MQSSPPQYQQGNVSYPVPVRQNQPYATSGTPPQYGSPQQPGSLGTPHFHNMWRQTPGSHDRRGSWSRNQHLRQSGGGGGGGGQSGAQNSAPVVLVPTRPLLKALARQCRPSPPWCVGSAVPQTFGDEILLFWKFLSPTQKEQERIKEIETLGTDVLKAVWPEAEMKPMSYNAGGIFLPTSDATLHYYVTNSVGGEGFEEKIRDAAKDAFQVEFFKDYRDTECVMLTESRSGERCTVRYGESVEKNVIPASEYFAKNVAPFPARKAAFVAVDALIRQNKVLNDTGKSSAMINAEAVMVMLLSIANSYQEEDVPDAGRLVIDFFLTFGFPAHFDSGALSVSFEGMLSPTPKVHKDSQLSVLDPGNRELNLSGKLEKVVQMFAVFNYCYTAISQFNQGDANERRVQSGLSTIIGGETYWGRVLSLYHQSVSPFLEVVAERHHFLVQN